MKNHFWLTITCLAIFFTQSHAQQNRFRSQSRFQGPPSREDTLRVFDKVFELDSIVQFFNQWLRNKEEEERLSKLIDQAEQLAQQEAEETLNTATKFHSGVRQQQALNPNISLTGDFFLAASTQNHEGLSGPGDYTYGTNNFHLRELELGIEAALDPYTRGKAFLSYSQGSLSLEEGYIELVNLPLNMNLRLGAIAPEFGPLNRYHDHALPQFDRPRALVNNFTTGQLKGLGLAADFMLPKLLWADASMLEVSLLDTGNDILFKTDQPLAFQYAGQFKNFYEAGPNTWFEYSFNTIYGKNQNLINPSTWISSLGLCIKHIPGGNPKYRTIDIKSEIFYGRYQTQNSFRHSKGFYCSIQNKVSARWYISGRLGYSEMPFDPSNHEWDYTAAIDFWQSEFVYYRLQYQYNNRQFIDIYGIIPGSMLPSDHSIVLQVCWAMGPHRHEAY